MFRTLARVPDHPALELEILDWWDERGTFELLREQNRGGPVLELRRRPGDREQDAGDPHGVGEDAQGRLPALQGAAGVRPALPERVRLPGPLDRGRRRARARAQLQARDRGVRARRVRAQVPREGRLVGDGDHARLEAPRPVDGLGQRLLHVLGHEHRVHLALPPQDARATASSTSATVRPSGAPAAARRSRRTSWSGATRTAPTRRSSSASRSSTAPGESLAVWTTTPWTLPANVAAAVNPEAEYGLPRERRVGRRRPRPRTRSSSERAQGLGARRPPLRGAVRPPAGRAGHRAPGHPVGRGLAGGGHRDRPHRARAAAPRTSSSRAFTTCPCSRRWTRPAASTRTSAGCTGRGRPRRPSRSSSTWPSAGA